MQLGYALGDRLTIFGKCLKLNLTFDAVLRVYDLQENKEEDDINKTDVSLRLLVRNYNAIKNLPLNNKQQALNEIFDKFINVKTRRSSSDDGKVVDFQQDAAYIYSSFMMDYGIDLFKERGRLDWRQFIALFQGLSDRTKIREVMSIRARKIPAPTKYNADEIKALRDAKAFFALDISDDEAHNNVQRGLAKLARFLTARAGGNNGDRSRR